MLCTKKLIIIINDSKLLRSFWEEANIWKIIEEENDVGIFFQFSCLRV